MRSRRLATLLVFRGRRVLGRLRVRRPGEIVGAMTASACAVARECSPEVREVARAAASVTDLYQRADERSVRNPSSKGPL